MNRRRFLEVLIGLPALPYAALPHELGGIPKPVQFRAVKLKPRILLDPQIVESRCPTSRGKTMWATQLALGVLKSGGSVWVGDECVGGPSKGRRVAW